MLPHKHVIISATVGAAAWLASGQPVSFPLAVAAGVLPDVDHIADYAYFRRYGVHRLIMPLHAYELALLGAGLTLLGGNLIVAVVTLSYLIHLFADQLENQTHRLGYSLFFRARHRFRVQEISTVPEAAIRGREADMRLLRRLLQR